MICMPESSSCHSSLWVSFSSFSTSHSQSSCHKSLEGLTYNAFGETQRDETSLVKLSDIWTVKNRDPFRWIPIDETLYHSSSRILLKTTCRACFHSSCSPWNSHASLSGFFVCSFLFYQYATSIHFLYTWKQNNELGGLSLYMAGHWQKNQQFSL